jgi:hypothetical protein
VELGERAVRVDIMDSQLLTVDISVATASLNVRRAGSITPSGIREEAMLHGEFSVLKDCICRDGLIWPRPRLVAVGDTTIVNGLGEFRNGASGDDWLIVNEAGAAPYVRAFAILLSVAGNIITPSVRKNGHYVDGSLPCACWPYRNQCWASNGLFTQMFDGRAWSDISNGRTMIAARLGGTAERKLFMANTPTYPDEYTWADANKEVSIMSKWPGMEPGGGTGVGVMLNQVVAPGTKFGIFAVGNAGYVIRTLTEGAAWFNLPQFTLGSLQAMATLVSGNVVSAYVGGMAVSTTVSNLWRTDNLAVDQPQWNAETLPSAINVYAIAIHSSGYVLAAGQKVAGTKGPRIHRRDSGAWTQTTIDGSPGSCVVRALLLPTTNYSAFACSDRNVSTGVPYLWAYDGTSWTSWTTPTIDPAKQGDFFALAGDYAESDCMYIAGVEGPDGKIWRMDYAAGSWTTLTDPPHIPLAILAIKVSGRHSKVYAVGQMGMIVYSADSGATWTTQDSGVSVALNSIVNYDSDPLHLMAVGDGGVCVTTVDGGTTWITPGVGELNPDKMVNSERFGAGESIRAKYQRSGQIAFFTNRGIRVLDEGTMKQQFSLDGFETFNDNCIGEWRNMIVMLGKMNGTPGIYGWDGSASPPRLLSEAVTGLFRPSPGNNYVPCLRCIPDTSDHIWDTEDDFRPRLTPANPGWAFNEDLWACNNGIMVMRSQPTGASATEITICGVSVIHTEPTEYGTDGIYIPNVTDWGIISFDYQLYHPADESKVDIELQVRTAPDVVDVNGKHTPGTWTGWPSPYTLPLTWHLDKTKQKGAFGRCTVRLTSDYANAANPWLQFRLLCKNLAQNDSDVAINRVILRAVVDGDYENCPALPCLVVHGDAVYAHFSLWVNSLEVAANPLVTPLYEPRCVVLAGEKMQASTIDTGNEIAAARVLNDVLYMGMYWHGDDSRFLPHLLAAVDDNNTPAVDYIGLSQEIRFMLDFAGLDAVARTLPKDLQKFYLSARPASYAGKSTVLVKHKSNDADDPTIDWDSDSLTFSGLHRPEGDSSTTPPTPPQIRHHVLDLESALTSENSTGRRFHFIIEPGTDASAPFIVEAAKIAAIVRGEDWATAYGGPAE